MDCYFYSHNRDAFFQHNNTVCYTPIRGKIIVFIIISGFEQNDKYIGFAIVHNMYFMYL